MGNLITAPVFPNAERTRRAQALHKVLWGLILIFSTFFPLFMIILPANAWRWLGIVVLLVTTCLLLLALNRRGLTAMAGVLLITLLWVVATGAALTAGGIRAPGLRGAYLCTVLIAGLLLGARAGIVAGLVCGLSGLGLVLTEAKGMLPAASVDHTPLSLWATLCFFIAIVIGLQHLAVKSTMVALQQSQSELNERKRAEEALRRNEEQLRVALEAAKMGTWDWEVNLNHVVWSQGVHRIFGLRPDEFAGTFEAFLKLVVPEDRDRVQRELADALEGRTAEYYSELRVRWPDGSVHWLEGRGKARRHHNGRLESMVGTVVDVTSRKQAEQTLRESEDRFRSLAASAFEGICITESGRVLDANDQMAEMLGYKREELIGQPVKDLVARESRPLVAEMMRTGSEGPYEHLAVRKDGSTFPVEVQAKAFVTAGRALRVTSIRDITERKRAEAALVASEESLRATIENTPNVAVQWYDREGRIVFWNRASELLYGWTAAEAAGKTLDKLMFTPEQAAVFRNAVHEIERSGIPTHPVEFQFRRRDGKSGIVLSTLFRIQLPSGEPRFVCMDVDLTERKATEASLRQAQENELRAREEFTRHLLLAQEQERQRLASELHDGLGQNLSVIKNRAHLAQQVVGIPGDAIVHLEAIERVVSEAITETRNLARNLRPLHIKQIGLTDSLQGLIREVSQSSDIHFERRLENVDDVFTGESATSLYRIVQEALNNLVKHSRARQARVTLERDISAVRLRVTDDGVGFDVQQGIPRSGLGLTSLAERARMLGGKLEIQSAPGRGTELLVELPLPESGAVSS